LFWKCPEYLIRRFSRWAGRLKGQLKRIIGSA
jgi:hypothetical protein